MMMPEGFCGAPGIPEETGQAVIPGAIWDIGPELVMPPAAAFDVTCTYRYALTRTWNPAWPRVVWLMLNPSKASALVSDPTIGRVVGFTQQLTCAGGIAVVNLFAFCATKPSEMFRAPDPVGRANDAAIAAYCRPGATVVVAWGAHDKARDRAREVTGFLASQGITPLCLGTTSGGHPRHPVRLRRDEPLRPFEMTVWERGNDGQREEAITDDRDDTGSCRLRGEAGVCVRPEQRGDAPLAPLSGRLWLPDGQQ